MKILLGLTGSIATRLDSKLIAAFQAKGHEVRVVFTPGAYMFSADKASGAYSKLQYKPEVFNDGDEKTVWENSGKILHIELAKWCDVLCVAPTSASVLGKFANGLVDNLLSRIYAAMPREKRNAGKIVLAPAMNTEMLEAPATQRNIVTLKLDGCIFVDTLFKTLVCGDSGFGAMAHINEIVAACDNSKFFFGFIPKDTHPGAFGVKRKHHVHTGVDLYVHRPNAIVYPFEDGEIVGAGQFTGHEIGMPFWNTTYYISVKSGDKVIVYGEIKIDDDFGTDWRKIIGQKVTTQTKLGVIIPVVNERKPQYEYHNTKMLHVEMFEASKYHLGFGSDWGPVNSYGVREEPIGIINPTEYLERIMP